MKTIKKFVVLSTLVLSVVVSLDSSTAATFPGQIVYVSDRDGDNNIYLMNMDGSNQTRLTDSTYDDTVPVFSPDGQKIAFCSNRSGSYNIYTMNWNGTGIQPILNSECAMGSWVAGRGLAWSPDGQKLLFKPTSSSLATINLDGSGKEIIWSGGINGHDYIQGVEWGSTMDDIYVNAQDPGSGYDQHIFRKTEDSWIQITDGLNAMSPQVSSHISRIVFNRNEGVDLGHNIYTMGLNGEDMVKLTFDTGVTCTLGPDWFDNGNGIVFSSNRSGSDQIWLMDPTGEHQQMLQGNGNNFLPSWTPIPEPCTLGLLLLGGLETLRRNSHRRNRKNTY